MSKIPAAKHTTVDRIYAAYEGLKDGERSYLGCSQFGNECDRALWYAFRWAVEPEHLYGRKVRLFQTGHREEKRMIEDLIRVGVEVDHGQLEVSGLGGHIKGHLDGRAVGFVEAPRAVHVLELKTHNDQSYKALLKYGVKKSKPGHYAQVQLYMHLGGMSRAFYLAHNKNDDSLYAERIAYDEKAAVQLMLRGGRIVTTDVAPTRLYPDEHAREAFPCQWCPALEACHHKAMPTRRNCRTCISSTPIVGGKDGKWWCGHWRRDLSLEAQRAGCDMHLFLPSLVPGEQFDASEEERTVSYRMSDGSTVVDGGEQLR